MEHKTVVVLKGIIIHKGKMLVVKRSEINKVGAGTWELIGGKLGAGEELEQALIREVDEETGLSVKPGRLIFAYTIHQPHRQLVFLNYLCEADSDHVQLSEEHTDYFWASESELKELLSPKMFTDLKENHVFEIENLG